MPNAYMRFFISFMQPAIRCDISKSVFSRALFLLICLPRSNDPGRGRGRGDETNT